MLTSEQFSDKFLSDEERGVRVLFNDPTAIGFSLTKEYPKTGLIFQPLVNQNGEVDSICLIKVYIRLDQVGKDGRTPLYVWVGISSKYLLRGRMRYDYEDKDSPSADELASWQQSPKPIELTEDDYIFDTISNKIFKKSNGNEVSPQRIIRTIFDEHLKTVKRFRGMSFRFKLNTRDFMGRNLLRICAGIAWINRVVFSREVSKDSRSYDTLAYEMFLKPTPHNLLRISQPKELKVFDTEFPVSKNSIIITSFLFVSFSASTYLWFSKLEKGRAFLFNEDTFLAAAVVIIWFVLFDRLLPHMLLMISNRFVVFADWIRRKRIKV